MPSHSRSTRLTKPMLERVTAATNLLLRINGFALDGDLGQDRKAETEQMLIGVISYLQQAIGYAEGWLEMDKELQRIHEALESQDESEIILNDRHE